MTNAVEFIHTSRRFGDVTAVDQVSLKIAEGEFFSMLGPSGSGKTTCLRLIAGFEQPDDGQIVIHGRDATGLPPYQRNVNTVFQDYALFPHMNVIDNIAYGLMVKGVAKKERLARAQEALELVALKDHGSRKPAQLSGGQRQRIALARALVNRPKVLLLDEPLGALDLKLREQMQSELKRLQRQLGITFVFVTHDQTEALSMSDRVAVFNQGRIEQLDTPQNLYNRPATEFVASFVGSANVVRGELAQQLAAVDAFTVRPEFVSLNDSTNTVSLDGTVTDIQYQGANTRIEVEVGPGIIIAALQPNVLHALASGSAFNSAPDDSTEQALPVIGSAVRIGWQPEAMVALQTAAVSPTNTEITTESAGA
ncbi:ABC transporter ATP-binding protein [Oceanobacter kriegii]|uniref:ABC transporter ATP-binding protein n=1 Tax=Oceanobacter kriegii TaxID=64972 RepID=UPI0003FFEAC1|nr:ABC transporter ATP-binding protein [Oceanobacter kriegii]